MLCELYFDFFGSVPTESDIWLRKAEDPRARSGCHLTTPPSLLWPWSQSPLKCTFVSASSSHAQTQPQSCHSLSTHIICLFTLCISYVLPSGTWLILETAPPLVPQLLKIVKDCHASMPSAYKPTNPKPYPNNLLLSSSHSLGNYLPALIAPGPGIRQLEAAPVSQSLPKLFRLAKPKPASPALPHLSHRNHNKGSGPHFPFTPFAF